jgi:Pyruvate/2-oxoacid:ferredoxin oxidoreductase delta subunit
MNPNQIKTEKRKQSENSISTKESSRRPGRPESNYLARCRAFSDLLVASDVYSTQEGFEYLYKNYRNAKPIKTEKTDSKTRRVGTFAKHGFKIQKGIMKSYNDLEPYLLELEQKGQFNPVSQILQDLLDSYPNKELWSKLKKYTKEKWDIVKIGFTELSSSLVFKNKMVLFRYVLVFMQEMKKDKMDKAPGFEAGDETMRVYASLGEAVNDIADWLRSKGIKCQSNHPMGGLVCTPPLAGKAGMGWQGRQGCLITPEFGARQRLAPIFIEEKIFEFTDNIEHKWVEEYCATCDICQKKCPGKAINTERSVIIDNIPTIGAMKTCIDNAKCFPYFLKNMGCSICIAVCPFSAGPKIYSKLKKFIKKQSNSN